MNTLLKQRLHFLSAFQHDYRLYIQSIHQNVPLNQIAYYTRDAHARYENLCFWATEVSRKGEDIMVMNNQMSCRSILRDLRNAIPNAFPSIEQFTSQEEYKADLALERSMTSVAL